MCEEVLKFLSPKNNGVYLDATFGQGGYSKKILEKKECEVIGIDRDKESKEFVTQLFNAVAKEDKTNTLPI